MHLRIIARFFALLGVLMAGSATWAAGRLTPYLEVQQVLDADFNNGGDVVTYTTLAAGADGSIQNKRVQAQMSYRYERRIPWGGSRADENVHNGVARGRADLVRNFLALEGGAIAMRAREDIRGAAPAFFTGNDDNITQVYGVYGGPDVTKKAGPLVFSGNYRFGYVKVSNKSNVVLPAGQIPLNRFDDATSHDASVSVGMPLGKLPFAWTVTGDYTRENANQLDQRYTGKDVRAEVTVPVSAHLALTGSVGYESILLTERLPIRGADGFPILNGRGRYVTDPTSPRFIAYDTDGMIWDVGAIWKPNRRTTVQARGGWRYGGRAITGSIDYQMRPNMAFRAVLYDGIDSFGRGLMRGLATLPTSFTVNRNPLTGDFGGCVFGTAPGTGSCLDDTLQSVSAANYRNRGAYAIWSGSHGLWSFGVGGGYANHKYLAPQVSQLFNIDGVVDQSVSFEGGVTRRLSPKSDISGSVLFNWYSSGLNNAPDVTNIGATATYTRNLTDRLIGFGAAGVYNSHTQGFGNGANGQALVGVRLQF